MTGTDDTSRPVLDPSGIGEFIKHAGCPRYLKLRYDSEGEETNRDWKEAFTPLSPLLSEEGTQFENSLYDGLREAAHDTIESWRDYDNQAENDATLRSAVNAVGDRPDGSNPTLLLQAHFANDIGAFFVAGDADLIVLWPDGDSHVRIRIYDIKSSWGEKTYHQIQTATYAILFDKVLDHPDVNVDYTIECGVLHRDLDGVEDSGPVDPDINSFDPEPRISDIKRLLDEDGPIDTHLAKDVDDVDYQFDSVCHTCPYNESCLTHSIESKDIRMLGLTRSEQTVLRDHGFETIDDVADLIEPLDKPKPYEYDEPTVKPEYQDKLQSLAAAHSIGERLPSMAQQAQALLGEINPDHPAAHDKPWPQWILGSGRGSLPDDDPHPDVDPCVEPRGSLIRVYLNVQWDHIRDRIAMLSGRVDSSNYDGTPLSFSEFIDDVPDDHDAHAEQERTLLEAFFENLFEAIRIVARLSDQSDTAPVHLYFYTSQERDAVMDAVKRHSDLGEAQAVRDLLGLRAGVDQSMVSVVQDEVETRLGTKYLSTGLLPVVDQLKPFDDDDTMSYTDWSYRREDGTKVDLRSAFRHELFDYNTPYEERDDGIRLLLGSDTDPDGWYPSRARFDAQIPLEYLWAAKGVDAFDTSWTDKPQYKAIIELYRWVDSDSQQTRITREDVMALGERFCYALSHVERGLSYKNPDVEKESLNLDTLNSFSLGDPTLADALRDYLDLEHTTTKQDALDHYRKPIKQRILTGKSVPMRVSHARIDDGLLHAEGKLLYDEFDFASPQNVANACRQSGSDDSSSGSWMVATPMENTGEAFKDDVKHPDQILHSTPVTIESFDPDTMTVEILGYPNGGKKAHDYREYHRHYTTDSDNTRETYFGPDEEFILDPSCDDMTAQRASTALDHPDRNELYTLTEDVSDGSVTTPTTDIFDESAVQEFVEWLQDNYDPSPNAQQRKFITEVTGRLSLLQGPPGTGKTSGSIALAVLARLYAGSKQSDPRPIRGLVTGASNKAVDEILADVADAMAFYKEHTDDTAFDDVKLVRLVGDQPANPLPGVDYVNYHSDNDELAAMASRLKQDDGNRQSSLTEHGSGEQPHLVVFSTPSRTFGFADKFEPNIDADQAYEFGFDLFDLYVADEASMLPLPQLLLGGGLLAEDSQALIAGDQRQMPPVQTHDWTMEDRRSIEELAPFLSTLDYFRFLRGETIDALEAADIDLDSPCANIPITRLQETYRCHTDVAEFLRRWVYQKDGIEYQSSQTHTIPEPTATDATTGALQVLNPESPITLVLHDDTTGRQSNLVEANLARKVVNAIPDSESIGVVTPHNSQKGLLNSMCNQGQVDTVERFQGGERDVMVVSATVSDPDYLESESEFILNPNRLTVALSRMKKKLVVLAPKSLFQLVPHDVDEYEHSTIWKGLYSDVNPAGGSEWNGSLEGFTGDDVIGDAEANVWVYSSANE